MTSVMKKKKYWGNRLLYASQKKGKKGEGSKIRGCEGILLWGGGGKGKGGKNISEYLY